MDGNKLKAVFWELFVEESSYSVDICDVNSHIPPVLNYVGVRAMIVFMVSFFIRPL